MSDASELRVLGELLRRGLVREQDVAEAQSLAGAAVPRASTLDVLIRLGRVTQGQIDAVRGPDHALDAVTELAGPEDLPGPPPPFHPARRRRVPVRVAGALAVCTLVAGGLWWRSASRASAERQAWHAVEAARATGLESAEAAAQAYLREWPNGPHADAARAERDWVAARRRADAVTLPLDRPHAVQAWRDAVAELEPAVAIGRDPALAARSAAYRGRLAEATAHAALVRAVEGASPEAVHRIASEFLAAHGGGLFGDVVRGRLAEAVAALRAAGWARAAAAATSAHAAGDHAGAWEALQAWIDGAGPEATEAGAMLARWRREDWEAAEQAAHEAEATLQFDRAAAAYRDFADRPHVEPERRALAIERATALQADDPAGVPALVARGFEFADPGAASVWQQGAAAWGGGDYAGAADYWGSLLADPAHGIAVQRCVKACAIARARRALAAVAAAPGEPGPWGELVAACEQARRHLPEWRRLDALRDRGWQQSLPTAARETVARAQALAAAADAPLDDLAAARDLYLAATPAVAANPHWRTVVAEGLAALDRRIVAAAIREAALVSGRGEWTAERTARARLRLVVAEGLRHDPANQVLRRLRTEVRLADRDIASTELPAATRAALATRDDREAALDGLAPLFVFDTPSNQLYAAPLAFTPDGRLLLTAGRDHAVAVWDAATGAPVLRLMGHRAAVSAIAVTPDGQRVLSADGGSGVRVWDLASGAPEALVNERHRSVVWLGFAPGGRAWLSAGYDAPRLWSLRDWREQRELRQPAGWASAAAFLPGTNQVAVSGPDHVIRVFDHRTGEVARELTGHTKVLYALAASADGRWLASGGHDDSLRVWEVATGATRHTVVGFGDTVYAVAFTPDGRHLLAGARDGTVRVWAVATMRETWRLATHPAGVRGLALAPAGRVLATASLDGKTRLWRLPEEANPPDPSAATPAQPPGPDAERFRELVRACESADGASDPGALSAATARLAQAFPASAEAGAWEATATGLARVRAALEADRGSAALQALAALPATHVAPASRRLLRDAIAARYGALEAVCQQAPDAAALAVAVDALIGVFPDDPRTLPWRQRVSRERQLAATRACLPTGLRRLVERHERPDAVLDAEAPIASLAVAGARITGFVFTPDGRRVLAEASDGALHILEVETGKAVGRVEPYTGGLTQVLAKGRRLLVSPRFDKVYVYDVAAGRAVHTYDAWDGGALCLAVAPRGQLSASSHSMASILLRPIDTGVVTRQLLGHTGTVHDLDFSPDGARLASGSYDRTARIWDVAGGMVLHTLAHESTVGQVRFVDGGARLATTDGFLRIWDVKTGASVAVGSELHSQHAMQVDAAGTTIVTSGGNELGAVWSARTGRRHREWRHGYPRAFVPGAPVLATLSSEGRIDCWVVREASGD